MFRLLTHLVLALFSLVSMMACTTLPVIPVHAISPEVENPIIDNAAISDFTNNSDNRGPVSLELALSGPPRPGETADLVLTINCNSLSGNIDYHELVNSRAWLEFKWADIHGSYSEAATGVPVSPEEILVAGDSSWQGSIHAGDVIELPCTIKLPSAGVWVINGYFSGEGWARPITVQARVASTLKTAAIMGADELT